MTSIETPKDHIVLVPVDFSDLSKHALFHAAKMASLFNDQITLLHIIETSGMFSFLDKSNKELMHVGIHSKMDEIEVELKKQYASIVVNRLIKEGRPHKVIVETADELNCDSIVIGSNGEAGLEKIVGSTASRVITGANVPVIVVKSSPKRPNYNKVVLPIDLTKETKQKVNMAIHLAQKINSEIHVIAEIEGDAFLRNKINANMRQVESILTKNNVKWVSKITDEKNFPGNIGDDTIKYSNDVDADLIMIMTQQETGFTELFLGSYAQQIINGSNVPVMCINPKEVFKFYGTEGFY
jgi:nucleotide-binding universal stress UspA family protein